MEQAVAVITLMAVLAAGGVLLVLPEQVAHNDQVERAVLLVIMFLVAHTSLGW